MRTEQHPGAYKLRRAPRAHAQTAAATWPMGGWIAVEQAVPRRRQRPSADGVWEARKCEQCADTRGRQNMYCPGRPYKHQQR